MNKTPKTDRGESIIHISTEEEERQSVKEAIDRMKAVQVAHRRDAAAGQEALNRLLAALKDNHFTGEPYKIRALLYSLWNGKPASLLEVVCLDYELRRDLCAVILGFGFEDRQSKFFYDAITDGLKSAGLWDWFLEEEENTNERGAQS